MNKELHLACKNGDLEKVKHLVQEGADPVECDQDGNTAQHSIMQYIQILTFSNNRLLCSWLQMKHPLSGMLMCKDKFMAMTAAY